MCTGTGDFGMWAALAIHDTSSVTAAAASYGIEALSVATIVKLTRAPWIILGFVVASLLFTQVSSLRPVTIRFGMISKFGFSFTLFLIGLSFDLQAMKKIAFRPLIFGLPLWLVVSIASLFLITTL